MNDNSPIDLGLLAQFVDPEEGIGLFRELLLDVMHETPAKLDALAEALRAASTPEIKSLAHSLRGMLANHGCHAIAGRLKELEIATPAPEATESAIAELSGLWQESQDALLAWLASMD